MTGARVLCAGDGFVLPALLADAARAEVPDADVATLTLPWPEMPFGRVGEVDEASGTEDQIIGALRGREVLLTQMAPVTERVLAACRQLRLVAVGRGGPVNVNLEAATRYGVRVSYAPGRNATATAEMAITLITAVLRSLPRLHGSMARRQWGGAFYRYEQCGLELDGTTVGLVGYGAVGSRVARVLAAFGADVAVFDPYVDPAALAGVARAVTDLDELLSTSRIVSLHARVTPETTGLLSAARLKLLPEKSYLVNCARGALVDYDAVCDELESGRLLGAAFDVYPAEPLPGDHRLFQLLDAGYNIVLSPHVAGASREAVHKAVRLVAAELGRYVRGEPLAACSNPDVLLRS